MEFLVKGVFGAEFTVYPAPHTHTHTHTHTPNRLTQL